MGTINKKAYAKLIEEDILEIEKYMPENSLEKMHIIEVLRHSIDAIYEGKGLLLNFKKYGSISQIPITLENAKKLKRGDVFLWKSSLNATYEIHTFHSDAGYAAKTFTCYNEKDGSSLLVNYSGIFGILVCKDN